MEVRFIDVKEARVERIFKEVLEHYQSLHEHEIILHQRTMPKTTMRAQPKLSSLFSAKRTYKVELSNNIELEDTVRIHEVPDDVLKGWFAHELGHVVDYLQHGFFGMVWFGIKYLTSANFRIRTEHEADRIAINHGMADDILTTKKYILEHSNLPEKYKRRIRKYYMSADDVMQLHQAEAHAELKMDEVEILNPKD